MNYEFGDVIHTVYYDFEGKRCNGTFCVCYDEGLDPNTHHRGNILCFKITTSLNAAGGYSINIPQSRNSWLKESSICQVSKIHTIDKHYQIKSKIHKLDPVTANEIHIMYEKLQNNIITQQHDSLKNYSRKY